MKHHTYIGIAIFALLVVFPPVLVYAIGTTSPLGGNISKIPAKAISDEEDACAPSKKNCPDIPNNTTTSCQWTYSIDENKTFDLDPDTTKAKGSSNTKSLFSLLGKVAGSYGGNSAYYIPRTLKSKVGTLSEKKNTLGLYTKNSTVQVGQCMGTYTLNSYPFTVSTQNKTVSTRVSEVTMWGTSSR